MCPMNKINIVNYQISCARLIDLGIYLSKIEVSVVI